MKKHVSVVLAALIPIGFGSLFGEVREGDSIDEMIEELGEPAANIVRGATIIYSYPEGFITTENGYVTVVSDGFYGDRNEFSRTKSSGESVVMDFRGPDGEESEAVDNDDLKGYWLENYAEVERMAAESGKPVILLFTGSDWCSWCQKLEGEIFSDDGFAAFASANWIWFKADFLQHSEVPEKLKAQNDELLERWNIEEYPTVIVADSSMAELGRTGYNGMIPLDYQLHLSGFLTAEPEEDKRISDLLRPYLGDGVADKIAEYEWLNRDTAGALTLSLQVLAGAILALFILRKVIRRS